MRGGPPQQQPAGTLTRYSGDIPDRHLQSVTTVQEEGPE